MKLMLIGVAMMALSTPATIYFSRKVDRGQELFGGPLLVCAITAYLSPVVIIAGVLQ